MTLWAETATQRIQAWSAVLKLGEPGPPQQIDMTFDPNDGKDRLEIFGLIEISDDLVRIHGVGPKIARLLVSMDITSFRQVARFTAEDVSVVNDALEVFPGRIERDDWMSSARELHTEVYGTEP